MRSLSEGTNFQLQDGLSCKDLMYSMVTVANSTILYS